jgi:uracil-DNA glycosylase family 4
MNDFQNALEFVHEALSQMSVQGMDARASRASRDSLQRLVDARPVPVNTSNAAHSPVEISPQREPVLESVESAPLFETTTEMPTMLTSGDKRERLAALEKIVAPCTKCPHLARTRTQTVFGVGNPDAEVMFVGEAPGADEDKQGEPFVGRAGQLLTKIIETMGFKRSDIFIANVLKCRPDMPPGSAGNRRPTLVEMQTCLPYLREQIDIIQPRLIVALGSVAMEGLLGKAEPMRALRGKWHSFQNIPVMATYHPAYLLRNQSLSEKRKVWEDMLLVLERLGKPISEKQRNYFLSK